MNLLGQQTGKKFRNLLVEMLENLGLSKKLISIKADNSSNKSTNLAAHVKHCLGGIFKAHSQLLGCMTHVINLAAHDGIKELGTNPNSFNKN